MTPTPNHPTPKGTTPPDHLDPDVLVDVAVALGADPTARLRHLERCGRCAASLEAVARIRAADAAPDPDRAAALAERVVRELGLGAGRRDGAPAPGRGQEDPGGPGPTAATQGSRSAWARWAGLAGAGLAAGLAAFGSVLVLVSAGGSEPRALPLALAAAALAALHPLAEEVAGRRVRSRPAGGR